MNPPCRANRPPVAAKDLQGFKYFALVAPLLERLHADGTASDKAGNRQLFFDQYAALLLLYFFNPILTSFNSLQQASALDKVQKVTGEPRVSKGSLSEAQGVFDASLLQGLIAELAERVAPVTPPQEWSALKDRVAVDGSLLPACSRLAWALWLDETQRAAKRHVHFEVLRGIPIQVNVTAGTASETVQRRATVTAGRLYVIDRGSAEYQLFQDIIDAGSSFLGRIRDNAVWQVVEERPVSAQAHAAGVRRDRVVGWGGDKSGAVFKQPLRIVAVATGKTDAPGPAGSPVAGDGSAGPGGGVGGVGVSVSLERGVVLPLVQVCVGSSASVERESERGDDPGVGGDNRQLAAQCVGGQEGDETHLRDVLFVLQRLGDGRGIDGPPGEPQGSRRQFLLVSHQSSIDG